MPADYSAMPIYIMHIYKFALSVLLLMSFSNLFAGQVQHLTTDVADGIYTLDIHATIDAKISKIWPIIDDFTLLPLINDAILAATLVPSSDPKMRRVQLKSHVCVWYFCKRLDQVQDIIYTDKYEVLAIIIPALSDFNAGWAKWKLTPGSSPNSSNLNLKIVLMPDFWVPPIIGPYLIKLKLRSEGLDTIEGLERLVVK